MPRPFKDRDRPGIWTNTCPVCGGPAKVVGFGCRIICKGEPVKGGICGGFIGTIIGASGPQEFKSNTLVCEGSVADYAPIT